VAGTSVYLLYFSGEEIQSLFQNSDQKKQLKSSFIIPKKDIFYARKSQAVLNNPSCPSKAHTVAFSKAFAYFVGKAFLQFII
jgi:hypothetical protein